MIKTIRIVAAFSASFMLSACGTTFEIPKAADIHVASANKMFAKANSEHARASLTQDAAQRRFARVSPRVKRAGESYCKVLMVERAGFDCDVDIKIDRKLASRNAYFTRVSGKPVIRISLPLLKDTGSDDEVAFVLSHEYGHLIGRHLEKQQQQALAGALILGAVAAAATAQSSPYGTYHDHDAVSNSMDLGAAIGSMAYSQSFELESDSLGARIAHAAGYDPVKGAQFFARPEEAHTAAGTLSFWGTHPPDAKRLATVLATVDQINANIGLQISK
ncbi:M48 family metallopeptidase [Cognatishimia sp. WU-CL00825]|uniref:M48 family metalloprotease n=1 Tax=Cognatishimia sp. WU-CL00825 TaxID=3127658 RepID=UPI00310B8402